MNESEIGGARDFKHCTDSAMSVELIGENNFIQSSPRLTTEEVANIYPPKQNRIKRTWSVIGVVAVILCAVFCGKIVGDLIVHAIFNRTDYGVYSEELLRDDEAAIIEKYLNGEIKFDKLTASDAVTAFVVTQYVMLNEVEYFKTKDIGIVDTIYLGQKIYSSCEKDGEVFNILESSKGIKNVANKTIYNREIDEVRRFVGKPSDDGTHGVFDGKFSTMTSKEFKNLMGRFPDQFVNYIISSKTVLESSVQKVNGNLKFSISLDPQKAVINYVKQMHVLSDIDYPVFYYINYEYVVDKNFHLVSTKVNECYDVNYGITVTCTSNIEKTMVYEKEAA